MFFAQKISYEFVPLRVLALSLYLPCLVFAAAVGAAILILPLFVVELGGNVFLSGIVLGAKGAGTLLMNVPAGALLSRLSVKKLLMAASILLFLMSLIASQAKSPITLLVCSLLLGAAVSLWFMARLKYVSDHIPEPVLGRAMATLSCIEKTGMLLGPLFAGFLIKFFDHGFAFYMVTLLGFIAGFLIYHNTENREPEFELPRQNQIRLILKISLSHRRVFLSVGSVICILLILRTAKQIIFPIWGLHIELDAAQIGLVIFVAGCVELLMFLPAGLILDHIGRKWLALPSLIIFVLGYALLSLADSLSIFVVAVIIISLGDGLSTGWGNTLITDLSPAKQRGEFFVCWRTIGDMGVLTAPLLAGYIIATFSLPITATLTSLLGIIGAIILAVKVKETRKK